MHRRHTDRWRSHLKTTLASGIATARAQGLRTVFGRRHHRPLILGYHRVVEHFESAARTSIPSMLVSRAMFERHLDRIGRHFRFVSLDEIGEQLAAGEPFTKPVAAVTFDDGYGDVYDHAVPILLRKGIPAAVFVVTDLVGRPAWQAHDKLYHLVAKAFSTWTDPTRSLRRLLEGLKVPPAAVRDAGTFRDPVDAVSALLPGLPLTELHRVMDGLEASVGNGFYDVPATLSWPTLVEMRRAGFTIGSHTRRHVSLPAESPEGAREELEGSRRLLEAHLDEPILHFAYPGGQFTPPIVEAVARAGYRFAYTACPHGNRDQSALTQERLILWERSSVDADGRFLPSLLDCQVHGLWPPARRCFRVHCP